MKCQMITKWAPGAFSVPNNSSVIFGSLFTVTSVIVVNNKNSGMLDPRLEISHYIGRKVAADTSSTNLLSSSITHMVSKV